MSKQSNSTVVSARIPLAVADKLKLNLSSKNISLSSALTVMAEDISDISSVITSEPPPNFEKGMAMIGIATVAGATSYGVYKGSKHLVDKLDTDLPEEYKTKVSIAITFIIMILLGFAAMAFFNRKK